MKYITLILTFFCFIKLSIAQTTNPPKELVVIKSTTNRNEASSGDYFIAEDLKNAFSELNYQTDIDYREEYHRPHKIEPYMNIYMRGYTKFYAPFGKNTNVLYVYYPMAYDKQSTIKQNKTKLNNRNQMPQNSSLDDDFQNYDIIAVASKTYTKELNDNNINAIYIPQFTNPQKFYPDPQEELKTDILFVGSNWHDRTSLRYAIEEGFNVSVYGFNWYGIIPDSMYKAPYISNDVLNKYYSSAKIVLNDHRPDMKKYGFVNNRIYDATASGTLVISDYIEEIENVYGNSVPMYKNKEELKKLLTYYLSHEEERRALAQKAREITLREYTNTNIAHKILSHVSQLKK